MTYTNWMIKGPKIGACSCDYGCPCEFNGRPTLGNLCQGTEMMLIEEGFFGEGADEVRLDGLYVGARFRWPGAVHEGRGTAQGFIDKRATDAQVEALFTILDGKEQVPTTVFNIYGSTIETELDPVFAEIDFAADFPARRGRFAIDGVVELKIEPIKNPVTGLDHFAQIVLPQGFEFREAEMGSATIWSNGDLPMEHDKVYASMFYAAYGPEGVLADVSAAGQRALMRAA